MPWFKVDDNFSTSPKVFSIPRSIRLSAIGAWTTAGNYSARNLTDGFVPNFYLEEIGASEEIVTALLKSGLWDEAEDGIQFHDWCDYQPSGSAHREKQERAKAKRSQDGKKGAEKRWQKESDSIPNGIPNGVAMVSDSPEPEPEPEPVTSYEVTINSSDFFDDFWQVYPRKTDKPAARKAYAKALKRTNWQVILTGANRYANDPNRDPTFTKHAATWLNNDCWEDDPLPSRTPVNRKEQQQAEEARKFIEAFTAPQAEITANPDWA